MNHDHFIVPPGTKIRLKDYDPGFTSSYKAKEEASANVLKDIERLAECQNVLYEQNTYALLVVLQAMDAAGKDGAIRHVMSGVNPQGTEWAPWYIIPADNKWFTHVVVADVIIETLKSLKLNYPVASKAQQQQLRKAKKVLENEPL